MFSFASLWGEIVKNKNCDGRLESNPQPWQLASFERPSLDLCSLGKGRWLTGILQGSIDEMSLQPSYVWWQLVGGKTSLKPGLAICLPNYFTACQKVIYEELGKEVYLKTSLGLVYNILRCLILLWTDDSFLPLKSMWELPAKQKEEAGPACLTKEPQELFRSQDMRQPERGNGPESQEKLRQLATSTVSTRPVLAIWMFPFHCDVLFISIFIHSRIHANGHSQSTQRGMEELRNIDNRYSTLISECT